MVLLSAASLPITSVVKIPKQDSHIKNFINMQGIDLQDIKIILDIRLPRVLMAVLVGIALSSSGVIFQGIFRNPMADPYILEYQQVQHLGQLLVLFLQKGQNY